MRNISILSVSAPVNTHTLYTIHILIYCMNTHIITEQSGCHLGAWHMHSSNGFLGAHTHTPSHSTHRIPTVDGKVPNDPGTVVLHLRVGGVCQLDENLVEVAVE